MNFSGSINCTKKVEKNVPILNVWHFASNFLRKKCEILPIFLSESHKFSKTTDTPPHKYLVPCVRRRFGPLPAG